MAQFPPIAVVFLPILILIGALIALIVSLRQPSVNWKQFGFGVVGLLLIVIIYVVGAVSGLSIAVLLGWVSLIMLAATTTTALLMLLLLPGKRKWMAFVVGLVFPFITQLGATYSLEIHREQRTICELHELASALEEYYQDFNNYPEEARVNELSFYLENKTNSCAKFMSSGKMYAKTANGYYLGSQKHAQFRWLGRRICIYDSTTKEVHCRYNEWGPFAPVSR